MASKMGPKSLWHISQFKRENIGHNLPESAKKSNSISDEVGVSGPLNMADSQISCGMEIHRGTLLTFHTQYHLSQSHIKGEDRFLLKYKHRAAERLTTSEL